MRQGGGKLLDGSVYYVIKVDDSSIKLATSYDNAVAGSPVALDLVLGNTLAGEAAAEAAIAANRTDNNISVDNIDIVLTFNGDKYTISIGETTDIATPEELRAYIQAAVDDVIGEELIQVVLGSSDEIQFVLDTLSERNGPHLFRSGYIYDLTADEEAAVVADFKVWTEEELLYSVNDGLLKEVSDTTITIEDPNVNGASVRLDVSGRIGEPSGSLDIDLVALRTETVTQEMEFSGYTLTLTSGDNWASAFVKGKQIFIEGSGLGNSGPLVIDSVNGDELTLKAVEGDEFTGFVSETARVSVSITMSDEERVTLAAAERNDVTYLSEAPISVEVDFDKVNNIDVVLTYNGEDYEVSIGETTDISTPEELRAHVQTAVDAVIGEDRVDVVLSGSDEIQFVLDPLASGNTLTGVAAAEAAIAANRNDNNISAPDTITRVSGDTFDTISVGDFIQVFGTSENATTGQLFYRVLDVDLATGVITLADDSGNDDYESANVALTEARVDVQIAPVVVDPKLNVAGSIDVTSDIITFTGAHGYTTGSKVVYNAGENDPIALTSGGTLTDGDTYYVIKVDNSSIKLATSYVNALAGSALDLALSNTLANEEAAADDIAANRSGFNMSADIEITLTINDISETISIGATTELNTAEKLRAYIQAAVDSVIGEEIVDVVLGESDAIEFALDPLNSSEGDHTISSTSFIKIARINLIEDFDVDASGTINAEAGAQMFLGSEGSFKVNNLLAGNPTDGAEARIKVGEDILQSSTAGQIRASTLILEAGAGTIGLGPLNGAYSPVRVNIVGDGTLTARAQEDVVITEIVGDMPVGTIFADQGGVYLETLSGSIIDGFDQSFTNIKANVIVLDANGGGIGEDGDYLDIDVSINLLPGAIVDDGDPNDDLGYGTITATAQDSIFLAETVGNLNIRNIISWEGDVDLRADASILDAVDLVNPLNPNSAQIEENPADPPSSRPVADITARNITLTAGPLGGIGVAGNDIDINSSYGGTYGALSIGGSGLNAYIIETIGDLGLNTISVGPGASGEVRTAYITAPSGSIYNRNNSVDGINVTSGKIWLFAANNIGTFATPITTQAASIEGKSTTGNFVVDNTGAVEVGGVIEAGTTGIEAGGEVRFEASSPITQTKDITADGNITLTAKDDANDSDVDGTADADSGNDRDFVRIIANRQIVTNEGSIFIQAGDGIFLEQDVLLDASAAGQIALTADFGKSGEEAEADLASIYATGATLTAFTSVSMVATGDIILTSYSDDPVTPTVTTATTVTATGTSIELDAGRDILINDPSGIAPTVLLAQTDIDLDARDNLRVGASSNVTARTDDIILTAGDDIVISRTATVQTLDLDDADDGAERQESIKILGDYLDTDDEGTNILIEGRILGQNVLIAGADDADTIELRNMEELVGHTRIEGRGGEDTIIIDRQPTLTTTHNRPDHELADGSDGEVQDTIDIDGGAATDRVTINITGDQTEYIINVVDSGAPNDGADELTINGTADDDTFLLRRNFVAYLNETGLDDDNRPVYANEVERINYDRSINGRLTVTGGDGNELDNDEFYVDDNSAITTLDGGKGLDLFQIGQVFGSNPNGYYYDTDGVTKIYVDPRKIDLGYLAGIFNDDDGKGDYNLFINGTTELKVYERSVGSDWQNIDLASDHDDIELLKITRGWLSQGISNPLTAFGGEEADAFNVYSNKAELRVEGEAGNDDFLIRAFLADDNIIAEGGDGDDDFEYNINAPVSINGGLGFDTVVAIGTEQSDAFIITEDGIFGAGLNIQLDGVEEALEVDGLEGDDTFFILSTRQNVVVTVIGGLGSDTFNVAGDITDAVVSQDLSGRSGVINQGTESGDTDYDSLLVDGVALTIGDPVQGNVIITETDGFTELTEDDDSIDSYTIRLARPDDPFTATAYLTVSAGIASSSDKRLNTRPDDSDALADSVLVSIDYDPYGDPGNGTWVRAAVLTFTQDDWDEEQTIYVKAATDDAIEGERKVMMSHSLVVNGNDSVVAEFDETAIPNVDIRVLDDDLGGILIFESEDSTRVLEGVPVNGGSSAIDDTVTVRLSVAPTADVFVNLSGDGQTIVTNANTVGGTDDRLVLRDLGDSTDYDVNLSDNGTEKDTLTLTGSSWIDEGFSIGTLFTIDGGTLLEVDGISETYDEDGNLLTSTITLTAGGDVPETGEVSVSIQQKTYSILFTSANWNQSVELTIAAANDLVRENTKVSEIGFEFTSADPVYGEAPKAILDVNVFDDDSPRVLVTESDGRTELVRGASASGDDYTLRLVSAPDANVYVNVYGDGQTIIAGANTVGGNDDRLVLRTLGEADDYTVDIADNGADQDTLTLTDGSSWVDDGFRVGTLFNIGADDTLYKVNDISETFDADGNVQTSTLTLTLTTEGKLVTEINADVTIQRMTYAVMFTADNWADEVRIQIEADEDFVLDEDQQFIRTEPVREHVLGGIAGPLIIEGGVGGNDRSLKPAVMLPTEETLLPTDVPAVTDEAKQADRLNVFNDSSTADDIGWMEATTLDNPIVTLDAPINITGLGMNPDADGRSKSLIVDISEEQNGSEEYEFLGGITFDDIEITEIMLGQGNDTFTIAATSDGTPGAGDNVVTVVHGGGNTILTDEDGNYVDEEDNLSEDPIVGGDHFIVTADSEDDNGVLRGVAGPNSPLVIFGDTSQDGARYDSQPNDGIFTGNALFYGLAGNDVIDASLNENGVTIYGGPGDDTISGSQAGDHLAGGSGNDTINGEAGIDHIYGDSGFNLDYDVTKDAHDEAVITRLLTVPTVNLSSILTSDPLTAGSDTIHAGADDDIVLGDHGVIGQADGTLRLLTTGSVLTVATVETWNGTGDRIYGDEDDDIVIGGTGDDAVDGGTGDDLVFGDNVALDRTSTLGDFTNPRFRLLSGTELYGRGVDVNGAASGEVLVDSAWQVDPTGAASWGDFQISLDDANFGNDYIAGGAQDDQIFGQLGVDIIQGDGSIDLVGVGDYNAANGELIVSVEDYAGAGTDGDDYIEGNSGQDVIFGNLGQDDIIGGSSDLFSLGAAARRADDADLLFGGAGTDIARNDAGDTSVNGHARDADMILGDNGNIFRIVGTGGNLDNGVPTFNYDNYGTENIVVRAAELKDYTPGGFDYDAAGAATDIGAGDEIHGESGDDFIYGMVGRDILYGDGQDDDIIGGYDHDWISGGTGQDGILGDDGRIFTSRNSADYGEPLNGVDALLSNDPDRRFNNGNVLNEEISTPGDVQFAIINVENELKKTVDLAPFHLDSVMEDPLFDPDYADDILYGGLGSDWIHGGAGDDAMSGAEALPGFFSDPTNPGDILAYNPTTGEFAEYYEYAPMTRIDGFLLNFNSDEGTLVGANIYSDGNDALFGDLGNDWIVGGTGNDNLYGGWGDDLLNADDDQDTNDGANDTPDTHPTYEDRAFGGAGRDRLIANTGGDRLIDWAGEFNSYIVPFAPFGYFTISRAPQPQLAEFLYALGAGDGVDATRGADAGNPDRNGEPDGELGVVLQQDFAWRDQTGAPDDVQPGNIPGGARDVLRNATFTNGNMDNFAVDSGTFEATNGRLEVSAESPDGDAVAVYHIDTVVPSYFEVQASITIEKPTGGWKANSYIIFDYVNEYDFKFAGIDDSINKLVIGHRDADGWHIDAQGVVHGGVKYGKTYNMLVAINGLNATLLVDNREVFSFTFEPRVVDGWTFGLNYGLIGVGSDHARGTFDNIAVQVLPPQITFQSFEDFKDGRADELVAVDSSEWNVDRRAYHATPDGGTAVSLFELDVEQLNVSSVLDLETRLNTEGTAGFIFDRYDENHFKFVAIDVASNQVIIGHHTAKGGWEVDAAFTPYTPLVAGTDYVLGVSLKGTSVSVTLDDNVILGHIFNASTLDGRFGLLASGSAATFDDIELKTNDPGFVQDTETLVAESAPQFGGPVDTLSDADLERVKQAAIARLSLTMTADQLAALQDTPVRAIDLPGWQLGGYKDGVIWIDTDAAGNGWFVDRTPGMDREFRLSTDDSMLAVSGPAAGRMDLLSVVVHEMGHAAGLEHGDKLMHESLGVGERTTPVLGSSALLSLLHTKELNESRWQSETRGNSAPRIEWDNNKALRQAIEETRDNRVPPAWREDFVNHLGRDKAEREPNSGFRVVVPDIAAKVVAETARRISTLFNR
jgi:Ca2+-binding RTX toxin-like protein